MVADGRYRADVSGHVFISYSHDPSSATYVTRLAMYLAAAGIPVWFDEEIVSGARQRERSDRKG